MKKIIGIATVAAVLAGCSTSPDSPALALAETEVDRMRAIPGIENTAASHVDSADTQLETARRYQETGRDLDRIEHHATLAMKHAQIAQERHRLQAINQSIKTADDRRQDLLLASSRQEAMTAKQRADRADARAELAAAAAAEARSELERVQAAARTMAAELKDIKSTKSERGTVLTLSDIVFETDSATILPGALRDIGRLATFLQDYADRMVRIEGFTDSRGASDYNQDLSMRRANAVKTALITAGVAPSRITTAGLGEEFPVASNATASGQQQNRRVEIIIANEANTRVPERTPAS